LSILHFAHQEVQVDQLEVEFAQVQVYLIVALRVSFLLFNPIEDNSCMLIDLDRVRKFVGFEEAVALESEDVGSAKIELSIDVLGSLEGFPIEVEAFIIVGDL